MLRVTVLGSGSGGNAILVDDSNGSVLVDVGFGRRTLERRFKLADRRPQDVQAVLLTHEHLDHAGGATAASARWQWPVLALPTTLKALGPVADGAAPALHAPLSFDQSHDVAGFTVSCTPVPHDAHSCAAMVLTDQASGARLGIALDLGHVPSHLPTALADCDLLVIESNHDERMLATGPYPWPLKQRVGGPLGHLSNRAAGELLARLTHRGLRGVILAHLSETNNTPATAIACARAALRRAGWRRDSLWAAAQGSPCGPLSAQGALHRDAPRQLSLDL